MSEFVSFKAEGSFYPNQIICLQHHDTCLYGEVIQIISQKEQCWFRPLFLVIDSERSPDETEQKFIRLNNTSDLLWPLCLFRYSLDTEVIPLLSKLSDFDSFPVDELLSRQYLHQFIKQVWQANQDKF